MGATVLVMTPRCRGEMIPAERGPYYASIVRCASRGRGGMRVCSIAHTGIGHRPASVRKHLAGIREPDHRTQTRSITHTRTPMLISFEKREDGTAGAPDLIPRAVDLPRNAKGRTGAELNSTLGTAQYVGPLPPTPLRVIRSLSSYVATCLSRASPHPQMLSHLNESIDGHRHVRPPCPPAGVLSVRGRCRAG